MKIAIPVSAHDKHLVPALTDCLLKLGGLEEHPVIFFPTPSAKEVAYAAAEKLGAQTHVLEQDFEGGAPVACNNHFAAVVYALAAMGNTEPFLWMEADCIPPPGAYRWPDSLQNEYRMLGQPFMGTVVDTPFNDDGKLAYREGDQMMMGCGVYPANMERDERTKPLILDLAKPAWMNPREPFDVYLRWAIKVIGRSHTKLICDMWATEKYRLTQEGIVCDSVDHGDRVVRARGGLVSKQAVLVHGCKDGSLAKLVLGEVPPPKAEAVDRVKAHMKEMLGEVSAPKPRTGGVAGVVAEWEKGNQGVHGDSHEPGPHPQGIPAPLVGWKVDPPEIEIDHKSFQAAAKSAVEAANGAPAHNDDDEFWGDESTPAPIPVKAPQPTTEYVPPEIKPLPEALKKKTDEPVAPPTVKITRAGILTAMDGKKMRVADLAKKLKVQAHDLIGTFPVNGFALLKAGWVQDTIPVTKD